MRNVLIITSLIWAILSCNSGPGTAAKENQPLMSKQLYLALYKGQTRKIGALFQKGESVKAVDGLGNNAIIVSLRRRDGAATITRLLELGIPAHSLDRQGKSALAWAAQLDRQESAKLLLARGAEINGLDAKKRTPLIWAAYRGHIEMMKVLVKAGAKIDHQNRFGETALSIAVSKRKFAAVEYLLKVGANRELADTRGRTPIKRAQMHRYTEIAKVLRETKRIK